MNTNRHPVTLLTGFLGSGKTTFLNALMAYKKNTRFAIIENEIGEADIDGNMVMQSDKNLMEVNNGCICCSLNDNFFEILKNLHDRKDEWDELLIEATGIADPAGVAAPFFNQPVIKNNFHLERIICLVDAGQIEEQLQKEEIAAKQIAYSDVILLNKADTVDTPSLEKLKARLQADNPLATIFSGQKGHYPLEAIMAENKDVISRETESHRHTEGHESHTHDHGDMNALTFTFEEPFDIDLLTNTLTAFLMFQAKDVYRIKGVVYDPDYADRFVIQSVMNSVSVEAGAPWKDGEDQKSRIVLIGKGLKTKGHERMLRKGLKK